MTRAIMVQGTMSNAGKSLITAALCRIFSRDGYKTAPFKSQNMALNSFVTRENLEMGRAQVTQAEAAGVEPDVRMNPILLKPVRDSGSQVILNGKAIGVINARNYYAMKKDFIPAVQQAYQSLADEFDVIVIEGAGSGAELNLSQDDFVNMGMARIANAPVLLVGDIDRGGIFAQLFGTVQLVSPEERAYIKGTIVNKFRGDPLLFEDGRIILENVCKKPCLGIVPFLDVDIEDEDSLSERITRVAHDALIDIAVVFLQHISNFTDFAALEATPGVGVRYVRRTDALGNPDLVILPGAKNTIGDLKRLREIGMEAAIKRLAAKGTPIIGICGGYQMLGERISDEVNAEGGGEIDGMGLLPVTTRFSEEKRLSRVAATACTIKGALAQLSHTQLEGYEIHMGASEIHDGAEPFLVLENGSPDGCQRGNVYGTYLHGFFDSEACRKAIFSALSKKGGSPDAETFDWRQYKNTQFDKLARSVSSVLDMKLIYKILEDGI